MIICSRFCGRTRDDVKGSASLLETNRHTDPHVWKGLHSLLPVERQGHVTATGSEQAASSSTKHVRCACKQLVTLSTCLSKCESRLPTVRCRRSNRTSTRVSPEEPCWTLSACAERSSSTGPPSVRNPIWGWRGGTGVRQSGWLNRHSVAMWARAATVLRS